MGQYQAYPFIANEATGHFKFQSVGKRGIIDKTIELAQVAPSRYNLALLDFDPAAQDYILTIRLQIMVTCPKFLQL